MGGAPGVGAAAAAPAPAPAGGCPGGTGGTPIGGQPGNVPAAEMNIKVMVNDQKSIISNQNYICQTLFTAARTCGQDKANPVQ